MNVFKLSVKEAFKTGLTPRKAKMKDAGGNHEKGGKLWAGCMEVIAVVSTVAVAWTFLKRFAVGDYPEGAGGAAAAAAGGGGGGGGGRTKGGYALVVNGGGGGGGDDDDAAVGGLKDGVGVEMSRLPTSTKPSSSKAPSALVKAGKNMFGAGAGKTSKD